MSDVARSRINGLTPEQVKLLHRGFVGEIRMGLWAAADIPDGWLAIDATTIGNGSSGATGRANDDVRELFNLLWTNATDAECPMQTSAGGASSRGASAQADWFANKRLKLPESRGFSFINKSVGGTANVLADTIGQLNHTHNVTKHFHGKGDLNITASGAHAHPPATSTYFLETDNTIAVQTGAGKFDSTAISAATASATHMHASANFSGSVGCLAVDGGVNGDNTQSSGSGNGPFLVVLAIIAY